MICCLSVMSHPVYLSFSNAHPDSLRGLERMERVERELAPSVLQIKGKARVRPSPWSCMKCSISVYLYAEQLACRIDVMCMYKVVTFFHVSIQPFPSRVGRIPSRKNLLVPPPSLRNRTGTPVTTPSPPRPHPSPTHPPHPPRPPPPDPDPHPHPPHAPPSPNKTRTPPPPPPPQTPKVSCSSSPP